MFSQRLCSRHRYVSFDRMEAESLSFHEMHSCVAVFASLQADRHSMVVSDSGVRKKGIDYRDLDITPVSLSMAAPSALGGSVTRRMVNLRESLLHHIRTSLM